MKADELVQDRGPRHSIGDRPRSFRLDTGLFLQRTYTSKDIKFISTIVELYAQEAYEQFRPGKEKIKRDGVDNTEIKKNSKSSKKMLQKPSPRVSAALIGISFNKSDDK
ncbi:hypothetical protein Trydic_g9190 [Trypoxylus dichotomus]